MSAERDYTFFHHVQRINCTESNLATWRIPWVKERRQCWRLRRNAEGSDCRMTESMSTPVSSCSTSRHALCQLGAYGTLIEANA